LKTKWRYQRTGRARDWAIGTISGLLALAGLIGGSEFGDVHAKALNPKLVAWVSAAVVALTGTLAASRLSRALSASLALRSLHVAGGAIRVLSAAVGYLFVIFCVLAVLEVSIAHLLIGAGLAGVVLGIAAQQSLGNVFAGLVLITSRPFNIGDRVRIRSGALGGIFEAVVLEIGLTYVTVRTDEGDLKIPNSAMLAAGIGRLAASVSPPGAEETRPSVPPQRPTYSEPTPASQRPT
jgi:small-conductance mechanosensitive channel